MRFKTPLILCMRCHGEIPDIDRSYSRKYCKECSNISIKENKRNHMRKRLGVTEKPCRVCGMATFNKKTCSKVCARKGYLITKYEKRIAVRNRLNEKLLQKIEILRNA